MTRLSELTGDYLKTGNLIERLKLTAVGGENTFSLEFIDGAEEVYVNGERLIWGDDYTTSSDEITLVTDLGAGDRLMIVSRTGNAEIPFTKAASETVDLVDGQTTVQFQTIQTDSLEVYVSGVLVDRGRLRPGVDYNVSTISSIELLATFPAGTTIEGIQSARLGWVDPDRMLVNDTREIKSLSARFRDTYDSYDFFVRTNGTNLQSLVVGLEIRPWSIGPDGIPFPDDGGRYACLNVDNAYWYPEDVVGNDVYTVVSWVVTRNDIAITTNGPSGIVILQYNRANLSIKGEIDTAVDEIKAEEQPITHQTLADATADDNSQRQVVRLLERGGAEYRRAADQSEYDETPVYTKFTDASNILWVVDIPYSTVIPAEWAGVTDVRSGGVEDSGPILRDICEFYKHVELPDGVFNSSVSIVIPEGGSLVGRGVDFWDTVFQSLPDWTKKEDVGSHIRFIGTGAKSYNTSKITKCIKSGGVQVINGLSHELLDFTNADAVSGGNATSKAYSAAIVVNNYSTLSDVRVVPNNNGIDGYNDQISTSLGDEWDVGIKATDAIDAIIDNVQCVGYWRLSSLLLSNSDDEDVRGNSERLRIYKSMFQGFRGISLRNPDVIKVISNTANSVTIPWDTSFIWDVDSNQFRAYGQGITNELYSYVGSTFNANDQTVTFTGVTPSIGGSTLFELRSYAGSNGYSSTIFRDCFVSGLEHTSGNRADQLGLGVSSPIEISGAGVRGVRFDNTKFQTHESSNGIFHNNLNTRLRSCQFEGLSGVSYLSATPWDSGSQALSDTQRGQTEDIRMPDTLISPSVDITKFIPRGAFIDHRSFSTSGDTGTDLIIKNWRSDGKTSIQRASGSPAIEINEAGQDLNIFSDGNVRVRRDDGQNALGVIGSSGTVEVGYNIIVGGESVSVGISRPSVDGGASSGNASFRWSEVFSINGTINTSDEREKDIEEIPDSWKRAAKNIKEVRFKWKDEVENKGTSARWHIGYSAQQVFQALEDEGIENPWEISFMCKDSLRDEDNMPLLDEMGSPIERWGLRYTELLILKMAE